MSIWRLISNEGEADAYLKPYRIVADQIMVWANVFMTLVCLAVAPLHGTYWVALLVAIPTLVLSYGLMKTHPGALMTRLYMGCAFMIYTSLLIQESHGDIEAHFSAFGLIGVLLYYRDWRTIAAATVFIYLQHLVGGYAQTLGAPIYVFDTPEFWITFLVHVAYFLPFVGMMGFLSIWLNREGVEQQRIIAKGQEKELALREATQRSEVANRLKSQFLANMSHEIRTPLNGVSGMLQLTLDTELTAQQRDYLQVAKESSEHLLALLNDILDFSRMESGALELAIVPTDVRALLDSLNKIFEPVAKQRGLAFSMQCSPEVSPRVMTDPTRLRQICINLISNAIKYTPVGWIRVCVSVTQSQDASVQPLLCLEVKDSGIGLDAEKVEDLFSPFVQADSSSTRSHDGAGLGLAITKSLVHLLGGDIHAQGVLNEGSTFCVTLPYRPALQDAQTDVGAEPTALESIPSLHVLVAEDHPINQRVIGLMLDKLGHRATLVSDGESAIASMHRTHYDLVLLDVMMPKKDGLDVLAYWREHERATQGHMPIIMVTAHAMSGDAERFLEAGADAYLTKPVSMEKLTLEVAHAVQARAPQGSV